MCCAHALWDEVFLSSHYINFHRMGAPVCVCPLLCCTECVRQVFPGRAHYKVLVSPTPRATVGPNLQAQLYRVQHVIRWCAFPGALVPVS